MAQLEFRADWPFPVNKLPFFYGVVIWLFSTVGILMSIPGQTMGIAAVFTDHFITAFGLTRTELAGAYFFGTMLSSFFLTRAGRFYDSSGARTSIVGASVGLGLFVVFIANIDHLASLITSVVEIPFAAVSFPLILLGYFGVRFTGQGVLTSASRNVLLVWYETRRGLAVGTRSFFATLAFSLAPVFLAFLINAFGWRGALYALALIVGAAFSVLAAIFVRDSPESCGLRPDGGTGVRSDADEKPIYPDHTAKEARQSPVFWIYSSALAFHSLLGTAIVFHIVAIFNESGRTAAEAFAYFIPLAVVSVTTSLSASWLSDRCALKPFLIAMLAMFSVGAWGLLHLDSTSGYWLMVVGMGITGGLWNLLNNLAFIRFFGRLHLGEIAGMNTTLTVIGSAVGPMFFSLCNDFFATFRAAIWFSLVVLIMLLIAAIILPQAEPKPINRSSAG
jgi:OFA family oxalate/formate antiporter-like MFS transporter